MEFHEFVILMLVIFVAIQRWYIHDLFKRVKRLEKVSLKRREKYIWKGND